MDEKKKILLKEIKEGKQIDFLESLKITLSDLLNKDENNIYYLEYAIKNKSSILFNIKNDISNNSLALYICAKNDYLKSIFSFQNEDLFFETVDNNQKLIDYIFENKIDYGFSFVSSFKKHLEIIDYLIKYQKNEFYSISDDLIIELLTERDGKYPLDDYIEIETIKNKVVTKAPVVLLLNYCKAKNNYDILKYAKEEVLLSKLENGKMIIEELLDRGVEPEFYNYDFKSQEILDILIKKNRIDLLYNGDIELLLSSFENDKTYFDLMIEAFKKGIDVHFEQLSFAYQNYSTMVTAKELLKLAQNDLIGFVPKITKQMLLYKGKKDKRSVLECLIDLNKELTVSKIINSLYEKDDPDFVIVLKNLGIDDNLIKFKTKDVRFSDSYIEQYNSEYTNNCESVCKDLLNELKELFYNDGKSDKKLVYLLISSYEYLTSINNSSYEMFVLELKQLIAIKKQNMDKFIYNRIDNSAYFNKDEGVCLANDIISTINHETSHALHYYLSNDYIPDNYTDIITRARNNSDLIRKVKEYSSRYVELNEQIKSTISKSKISDYYENLYKDEKLLELATFLSSSKEEQKNKFKSDYNEQVLDTILAKTYSVDEFIKQRKEIEVYEIVDATLRNDYAAFIAISDIIDAIFLGKYRNGALFDSTGSIIDHAYGHGIKYYSIEYKGMCEMIANYGTIIKSKNSSEMLLYLRNIVGNEVVDMIEDVYENKILKSDTYIHDLEGEIKHAR